MTTVTAGRMGTHFWRAFAAYATNTVGDTFYSLAVPLVLLQLGYTAATTTFLRTAVMATTVAAGFVVGYLVDQRAPGRLLALSYWCSAAVLIVGAGMITLGTDGYVTALAAATALGLFTAVSAAAVDAGVPQLVTDAERIRHAYSLIETARATASVMGPALAGLVAAARNLPLVMAINAFVFFLAGALAGIRGHPERERVGDGRSALREILHGAREITSNRFLRLGIALSLSINISLGAEELLVIIRLVRDFSLPTTETSLVVVAAGVTSIMVSFVVTRLVRAWPARRTMIVSALLVGMFGAGQGLAPDVWILGLLFCATTAATICYTVHWRSYRQALVSPDILGRVSATCRSLAYSGIVVGTAIVGGLQLIGISAAMLLTGGGAVCVVSALAVSLLLSRGSAPSAQSPRRR